MQNRALPHLRRIRPPSPNVLTECSILNVKTVAGNRDWLRAENGKNLEKTSRSVPVPLSCGAIRIQPEPFAVQFRFEPQGIINTDFPGQKVHAKTLTERPSLNRIVDVRK